MLKTKTLTLNELIVRTDISWKAKGLAIAIAYRADKFREVGPHKIQELVDIGSEQEVSVRNGLRELEKVGILMRKQCREEGYLIGSTWEINLELTVTARIGG